MIFEKFSKTVFTKNGNRLKRKYEALKELKRKYPNNKKINDEYMMVYYGLKGEDEIAYELKDADIGMYVLRDITIKIEDSKAQIDYIIITPAHSYLVECKNLVGNIIIDSKGEFIREYFEEGKKIRKGMYSPVRQAEKHKEIFKKIWKSKHNKFVTNFLGGVFDGYYKTLVVMAKADGILEMTDAPKDIKDIVIKSDNLVEYLKKDIANAKKSDLVSQKQMKEYSDKFLMMTVENNVDYISEYIEKFGLDEKTINNSIKGYSAEEKKILRNKLIDFRKNKAKERKIPAYYIFTNKELENLLIYMPKNIEELKEKGILTEVKIKLHGEEIVRIINS